VFLFRPSVQTIFNDFAIPSALIEAPLQNSLGTAGRAKKMILPSMILPIFSFIPKADCSWRAGALPGTTLRHWGTFILEEVARSAGALYVGCLHG
jgi:hypothetical protein